jgi:hypothetical protein
MSDRKAEHPAATSPLKKEGEELGMTVLRFLNQIRVITSPEELILMMQKHMGIQISFSLAWDIFCAFRQRQKDLGVVL